MHFHANPEVQLLICMNFLCFKPAFSEVFVLVIISTALIIKRIALLRARTCTFQDFILKNTGNSRILRSNNGVFTYVFS